MKIRFAAIIMMLLSTGVWGRAMTPEVEDSLHLIHPRLRAHWLKERGIDYPGLTSPLTPDSLNMTCVGRWSYGPSYDVTGQVRAHDTLVYLARGSGISVLQFHGGSKAGVTLLSDINATGIVKRIVAQDSWLIIGSQGFEIYNLAQPTDPVRVSYTRIGINDLAVQDSFLYTTSGDSFCVFSITNKANPRVVGFCSDSGGMIGLSKKCAFLVWGTYGWHGMYILDISNPAAPHRVGAWNSAVSSVTGQRNLCYISDGTGFHILNVANPSSPQELGSVGVGAIGMRPDGNYVYLSCFATIDVSDSMMPGIVGQCTLAVTQTNGVWATGLYGTAFSACYIDGLGVVDLSDPVHPVVDSVGILAYDDSRDISVDGAHAVVANDTRGARIFNVADPRRPCEIASYDSAGPVPYCNAAQAFGSTVYMGWSGWDGWRGLYVISFADSTSPTLLGKVATVSPPAALAIRDSWAYSGEQVRFQVIDIEDSLHPSIASTCTLGRSIFVDGVSIQDSLAYVADGAGIFIIDIAQPSDATPIGYYAPPAPEQVYSVAASDTISYVGTGDGLRIVDVANPASPEELGFFSSQGWIVQGVQVRGKLAVIGNLLKTLDVSDPANPRMVGLYVPPTQTFRICWADSLIYATCLDGGIVIVKYTGPDGCAEAPAVASRAKPSLAAVPNPTNGICKVEATPGQARAHELHLFDSSGRLIRILPQTNTGKEVIDLSNMAKGVYFIGFGDGSPDRQVKVVVIK